MISETPIKIPQGKNPRIPAPAVAFYHLYDLQIRFNDIDILGHINNSVYLSFFDLGKAEYFVSALGQKMEIGKVGVAIVNINCSFFSPSYFNEPLQVVTAITSMSVHSFKMEQRIFNPVTGDVKCISNSVLAGFDPATATSIPLPEEFIARAEAFEHRRLVAVKQ